MSNEAGEQYNIPISVLREYESWGPCDTLKTVMGVWPYEDAGIERLSMIMTLHDIGFEHDEIANYMRLLLQGDSTPAERMRILKQQGDKTPDEIHFQERRLDRLDYLRRQMRRKKKDAKKQIAQVLLWLPGCDIQLALCIMKNRTKNFPSILTRCQNWDIIWVLTLCQKEA